MDDDESDKSFNRKFFQNKSNDKYFILANYFEDVKNPNKKNMLPNQMKLYINAINEGIDSINNDDILNGFYSKFFNEYYRLYKMKNNSNKAHKKRRAILPDINSIRYNSMSKIINKYDNNNISNKKISYSKTKSNVGMNKTFNINKTKEKNIDTFNKDKFDKYNIGRQSIIHSLGNFTKIDEKDFYIRNYNLNENIYNITEEGKVIERKLINKEKKKYFSGFKTKYNGIMRKNKKNMIDINEFINGKGGKKNNTKNDIINKYKIAKIQNVLKQIDRKIKKINQKKKIKDIMEDIKQFREKEKITQDKFRKTDDKFNNLILDSDIIKKRILKKFSDTYY